MSADVPTINPVPGDRAIVPLRRHKRVYIVNWPDSPHDDSLIVSTLERAKRLARNETDWDERVEIYRCELERIQFPTSEVSSSDVSLSS